MNLKIYKHNSIFWLIFRGRPKYADQRGISLKLFWIVFLLTDNYKKIDYIKKLYENIKIKLYNLIKS